MAGEQLKTRAERRREASELAQKTSDFVGKWFGWPVIGLVTLAIAYEHIKNWGGFDSNMLPDTASIPNDRTPLPTSAGPILSPPVEYSLAGSDGITQGIMELRDKWPKGQPMPDWLNAIEKPSDAARWAEQNGWYKPGAVKDSVVMYKGDVLSVDTSGKLTIKAADGSVVNLATRPFSDTMPTRR